MTLSEASCAAGCASARPVAVPVTSPAPPAATPCRISRLGLFPEAGLSILLISWLPPVSNARPFSAQLSLLRIDLVISQRAVLSLVRQADLIAHGFDVAGAGAMSKDSGVGSI